MKRHWTTHHANEGPYVQDRYPPFEDLWRLVGEGEVVLSPPAGTRRSPGYTAPPAATVPAGATAISPAASSNQPRRVSTQSSPISNQDSVPDSESDEEMPHSGGGDHSFSPYVRDESHFYGDDRYGPIQRIHTSIGRPYGPMDHSSEFLKGADSDSLSSGPGPGHIPASISPFELSLLSHPPAGHPLQLYNRLPLTRCP